MAMSQSRTRHNKRWVTSVVFCVLCLGSSGAAWASASVSGGQDAMLDQVPAVKGVNGNPVNKEVTKQTGLERMSDQEMAGVSGQALFVTNMIDGDNRSDATNGLNFYRAGLDASLDLNMNIKELELGRTGPDNWPTDFPPSQGSDDPLAGYDPNVDIWAENVAFGCVADSQGNCVDSTDASATQLKPVTLTRPYLEFAIENDDTKTQREVVGIRVGAENINGPLSFGLMKVFSGHLTASANMTMEGMTNTAVTCGREELPEGCPDPDSGNSGGYNNVGVNTFDENGYTSEAGNEHFDVPTGTSLGLNNDQVCSNVGGVNVCGQMADLTATFSGASTQDVTGGPLSADASGKRMTEAQVRDPYLADLIDAAVSDLEIGDHCNAGFTVCQGGSWFPSLIRGPAAEAFKDQVCAGLNISNCTQTNLNTTPLPYNLTNFHRVEVNSDNLGLSFQRRNVRYPGYLASVQQGWAMHLPDAFTLNVSKPAAKFTNNIANGAAGTGDLVGLPPVYDNCWGAAQFC